MIYCEGIPVRGLSLVVSIIKILALQCQYGRAGVTALWVHSYVLHFLLQIFVSGWQKSVTGRPARPPNTRKRVRTPVYSLTFRGLWAYCYKNAEKNETAAVCAKCLIIRELQRRPESPVTVLDLVMLHMERLKIKGFGRLVTMLHFILSQLRIKIKNFKICIRLEKICNIVTGGLVLIFPSPGA